MRFNRADLEVSYTEKARAKKVLFLGNSHTYFNDMPYYAEYISKSCGIDGIAIKATMLADGGRSLKWHATQKDVRYNIIYGEYDFIIFQNNAHPFDGYEELREGTEQLLSFVEQAVKKPTIVMYMTWSKKENPEDFKEMRDAYRKIANDFKLKLAPVGENFYEINANYNTELYDSDGAHTSKFGAYIAALTIVESLFEVKIHEFPKKIDFGNRELYSLSNIEMDCIENMKLRKGLVE